MRAPGDADLTLTDEQQEQVLPVIGDRRNRTVVRGLGPNPTATELPL
jgi:hypothetical protein